VVVVEKTFDSSFLMEKAGSGCAKTRTNDIKVHAERARYLTMKKTPSSQELDPEVVVISNPFLIEPCPKSTHSCKKAHILAGNMHNLLS